MKHKNIPMFIPHEGCGHSCIFCSQRKITGVERSCSDIEQEVSELRSLVEQSLDTIGAAQAEIAFFGGSFTGIERGRMIALLECASGYIGKGVSGIRLSTRPDYISNEICEILSSYGVTAVELGIQSVNDRVLELNRRGHTALAAKKACSLVKEHGFLLTCQMMVGMYGADSMDELETARAIVEMGADSTRIYPTVVFDGTALMELAKAGSYIPLDTESAVRRSADCAEIFIENHIDILRIGLHSSQNLEEAPYGASHPALGELVMGEIYYRRICRELDLIKAKRVIVYVPTGEMSKAVGQKGINRQRLQKKYPDTAVHFSFDNELCKYFVRTESIET